VKPFDFLAHAVRGKEIFTILARYGFADLLDKTETPHGFWQRLLPHPDQHLTTPERVRMAAEELGPTFVKFGQLLSMRPDLVPHAFILELRKLQSAVTPLPFTAMQPVLERELRCPYAEVFADFDETAAACASLAQVYFAKLRGDGRSVAVKVQKPDIAHTVEIDLDLAGWLAHQLHLHSDALQPYDLPAIVEEVRRGVMQELDFRNEARNQQYFNSINPHPEQVYAPAVMAELSTERVLVTERIHGTPVDKCELPAEQRAVLAGHGASSLVHQVLVAGFFHADPHAGNVFVGVDGRLVFIDWGLVGHLTRRLRYALADFWLAAIDQDAERIVRIAAELAPSEARPDLREMEKEVTLALREELNFTIGRQHLGRAMLKLLFIFGQHGIPLSRDYSLMAKAVLSIEEVGRMLDPEFDLRAHAKPVLQEVYGERTSPRTILKAAGDFVRSSLGAMQDLPSELRRLVRRLEHDNLTINFQHRGLDQLEHALKIAANRIALGVVVGSLLIGSSLIVTTGLGPRLFGYPALGFIGYLISALFALYMMWDIVHQGRKGPKPRR
jgi:ubiquinone biosynthesis protein